MLIGSNALFDFEALRMTIMRLILMLGRLMCIWPLESQWFPEHSAIDLMLRFWFDQDNSFSLKFHC